MDNNTLTTAGLASTFTVVAAILYKIFLVINHKRCKSNCCGKNLIASFDVEETTPPSNTRNNEVIKNELVEQSQRKIQVLIPQLDLEKVNNKMVINPMRI
jgi:hypothetical protein